jgi:acetolactate synthase-1/3 small subunit
MLIYSKTLKRDIISLKKWKKDKKLEDVEVYFVMRKMVLSVLVGNTSGVLNRVAGLFSRRGYNIDSLTVGETENPAFSRMTIVVHGEDEILEQIEKQISKLVDVKEITELKDGSSVCRELILVKVAANAEHRQQIIAIADVFRAKIVDVAPESLMVELTGNQAKLDAFIGLLGGFKILELVRTGITGLTRGIED